MTTMSAAFLSDAAERLRASVVGIANGRRGRRAAGGAAIAWSSDLFVTSAHVVTASHATIVTPDGRAVPGEVVRRDAERDIAVVRAAGAGVPAAVAGDPYALRSGSLVFAVGHPFGVRDAVSVGVLQAVSPVPRGCGRNGSGSFVGRQPVAGHRAAGGSGTHAARAGRASAGRAGPGEQGNRGGARSLRSHGEIPPGLGAREARRALPHRGRLPRHSHGPPPALNSAIK